MAHHRPIEYPSYYFNVRKGNEDSYLTHQEKHQDVPVEVFAPYMHPTSHYLRYSNTSAPDDGQVHIGDLPAGPSHTAGFFQVFEPPPSSLYPFSISDPLLEYPMNVFNHSPFHNQPGSALLSTESLNRTMLISNELSAIGFDQPIPVASVLGQARFFGNTPVNVDTVPESIDIGHSNVGETIPNNEPHSLMNSTLPWVEPLHNRNGNTPLDGIMLENMEYGQPENQNNIFSLANSSSHECSSTLPYTSSGSCDMEMDTSYDTTWALGIGSLATILPILPPVNFPPKRPECPPCIAASMDRKSSLHDDTRRPLVRQIRAKNVVIQQDTSITSSYKCATARKTKGVRKKVQWNVERRISAAQMRKLGTCSRCRLNKVKCSKGDVCDNCHGAKSPYQGTSCHRSHLVDYLGLLLPQILIKHFSQDEMKDFNNSLHFTEEQHLIEVSTGRGHPLIKIRAHRIITPDEEFLVVPALTFAKDHAQTFTKLKTLDYALRDYDLEQVKQELKDHIETISTSKHIKGDPRTLRHKLLLTICRFLEALGPLSKENDILRKVIMINRIQHIMCHLIVIRESSELNEAPHSFFPSARVLNRQLKSVLFYLQKETTAEVLRGLDMLLWQVTNDTWGICLSSFLVLSMCIEDVQVAIDLVSFSQVSNEDGSGNPTIRDGTDICTKLEKEPLENSWILLRWIMKKIFKNRHHSGRGCMMDNGPGQHAPTFRLWEEISQLMVDHNDEIWTKSSDHYQGGGSRFEEDHLLFRRRNEGRLTCIALRQLMAFT